MRVLAHPDTMQRSNPLHPPLNQNAPAKPPQNVSTPMRTPTIDPPPCSHIPPPRTGAISAQEFCDRFFAIFGHCRGCEDLFVQMALLVPSPPKRLALLQMARDVGRFSRIAAHCMWGVTCLHAGATDCWVAWSPPHCSLQYTHSQAPCTGGRDPCCHHRAPASSHPASSLPPTLLWVNATPALVPLSLLAACGFDPASSPPPMLLAACSPGFCLQAFLTCQSCQQHQQLQAHQEQRRRRQRQQLVRLGDVCRQGSSCGSGSLGQQRWLLRRQRRQQGGCKGGKGMWGRMSTKMNMKTRERRR